MPRSVTVTPALIPVIVSSPAPSSLVPWMKGYAVQAVLLFERKQDTNRMHIALLPPGATESSRLVV